MEVGSREVMVQTIRKHLKENATVHLRFMHHSDVLVCAIVSIVLLLVKFGEVCFIFSQDRILLQIILNFDENRIRFFQMTFSVLLNYSYLRSFYLNRHLCMLQLVRNITLLFRLYGWNFI